jgi:hypothetical protein
MWKRALVSMTSWSAWLAIALILFPILHFFWINWQSLRE